MSRVVDNRVVEMEFDNSNFEKNVGTSLSTLDKLKAALSFKGTEDDFSLVERAAEGVGKSFSLMEQVAIGALRNFGSKLENWAENTIKTMSGVENAIAGLDKFEKITKSSATLLAQGFSTREVQRELSKLNWFTDETSYSMTDMVDNISKFTATGQGLQESADAMMGIALWAAKAGQDAPTASRAMYQLSQAMGAYMRKEDWKSIQNANMDMKEFRQLAMDTAVEVKTLKKNTDGTYQSLVSTSKAGAKAFTVSQFADSLTEGAWFTPEVMMKVYSKYNKAAQDIYGYMQKHVGATVQDAIDALGDSLDEFSLKAFLAGQEARSWGDAVNSVKDALSTKWMGIFQHIFGSSKQATQFFTDLSYAFYDMFVEPMSGVVESFHKWRNAFGRKEWQSSLISMLESMNKIMTTVRNTIDRFVFGKQADILVEKGERIRKKIADVGKEYKAARKGQGVFIPDDGSDGIIEARAMALMRLTKQFTEFSKKFEEFADKTKLFARITNGILSVFGLLKLAISDLWKALDPFKPLVKDLLGLAVEKVLALADSVTILYAKASKNRSFAKIFSSILRPFVTLKDEIGEFIDKFVPRFNERWDEFASHMGPVKEKINDLKNDFSDFTDKIKSKWENLFGDWDVEKTVDKIFDAFSKVKSIVYDLVGVQDDDGFAKWLANSLDSLSNFVKAVGEIFATIWDKITSVFKSKGDGGENEDFATKIAKIGNKIGKAFQKVIDFLSPIFDRIKEFFSALTLKDAGNFLKGVGVAGIGAALYSLIYDVTVMWGPIGRALKTLLDSVGEVFYSFSEKLNAEALKDTAIAIGIIVGSILVLTLIPMDKLLTAATVLVTVVKLIMSSVATMGGFSSSMSLGKNGFTKQKNGIGSAMLGFAAVILAVAVALTMISKIPTDSLYAAMTVIIVIVTVISVVISRLKKIPKTNSDFKVSAKGTLKAGNVNIGNGMAGVAGVLIGLAAFILVLTNAVSKLTEAAEKNPSGFGKAIISIGAILVLVIGLIFVAKKATAKSESGIKATKLIGLALGMVVIASAFSIMFSSIANLAHSLENINAKDCIKVGLVVSAVAIIFTAFTLLTAIKDVKATRLVGMATGMVLIAAAFAIMFASISGLAHSISDVNKTTCEKVALAIASVTIIFAAFTLLTTIKTVKATRLFGMAVSMVLIAAAFAIMFASISGLAHSISDVNKDTCVKLAAIVGSITLIFAAFTLLTTIKTVKATRMFGMAASMVLIAFAFDILFDGISELSMALKDTPKSVFDNIIKSIAYIGLVLLAFAAFSSLKITNARQIGKVADAFTSFSLAILIMSASLYVLGQIDEKNIGSALLALTAISGILVIMGAIASTKVGQGIVTFAEGLGELAKAAALLAIALLALAKVFSMLGEAEYDFDYALERFKRFVAGAGDALLRVGLGLITTLLPGFLSGIIDAAVKTLESLLEKDANGTTRLDRLINTVFEVVKSIVTAVKDKAPELVPLVGDMILSIATSLVSWVKANSKNISATISEAVDALLDILLNLFAPLGEKIFGEAWDGENGIATLLKTTAKAFLGFTVVKWVIGWAGKISGIVSGVGSTILSVIEHAKSLIGLMASSSFLQAVALVGGAVVSYGLIDEAAANKRQEGLKDARGQRLIDYYTSKEHLADTYAAIRAAKGVEVVSPDMLADYIREMSAAGYDVLNGKLVTVKYLQDLNRTEYGKKEKQYWDMQTSKTAAANAAASGAKLGMNTTSSSGGNVYIQVNESPNPIDHNEQFRNNKSFLAGQGFTFDPSASSYNIQSMLLSMLS